MNDEDRSRKIARGALEALVEELRGRCEAACRFSEGNTYYGEEVAIFERFVEEEDLYFDGSREGFAIADRPCDDEGNEHQVWFDQPSDSYLKATFPGFFGKLVVYLPDETPDASPIDYLERWRLHNRLFGDDVQFLGAWQTEQGLRLVIRQPAIAGVPADEVQIREYFESTGWLPFFSDGNLAFFDPDSEIAVSDTHPGNLILMSDGNFAPIDLRVQQLTPTLAQAVRQLIS